MGALTDAQLGREFGDAGGAAAGMLAGILMAAGLEGVCAFRPSALYSPEPIVVEVAGWEREARLADGEGERGLVRLNVLVVRESFGAAEAVAHGAERSLRKGRWEGRRDGWYMRMAGLDTELPQCRGQDGSGRWVFGFEVLMTIARDV